MPPVNLLILGDEGFCCRGFGASNEMNLDEMVGYQQKLLDAQVAPGKLENNCFPFGISRVF